MQEIESSTFAASKRMPLVILIAGGLLITLFHLRLSVVLPEHRQALNTILLVLGLVLFFMGGISWRSQRVTVRIQQFLKSAGRVIGLSANQFLLQFFAVLLAVTVTLASGFEPRMTEPVISILSWCGVITLCVAAGWEEGSTPGKLAGNILPWTLGLFLLAFLLRGFNTAVYPNALSGDEASFGIFSTTFRTGRTNNLFFAGWYSFPSFFYFIQSWGILFFGQTTEALRIPSAVVGALTVLVAYLVAQAMFGRRAALLASILLVFSHFHIHFSRLGLNNIWDGFWWTATLGSLWWGWKQERKAAFTLAGVCLGLSQYFYTSTRGLYAAIPVWLFFVALQDWQHFKRLWPHILRMFIISTLVYLPLAWFYFNRPNEFNAPMLRVSILGDWLVERSRITGQSTLVILVEQFIASVLGLTYTPLKQWYAPGTSILRPAAAGLFYLSLVIFLIKKYKDSRLWLIFLWLGVIITGGALSKDTPGAQRYIAAAPPAMMIIGYGINEVITFLGTRFEGKKKLISAVLQIIVLIMAVSDSWFYFYDYSPLSNFGGFQTQVAQRLATSLRDQDDSLEVMFMGWPEMGYRSINSLSYLAPQIEGIDLPFPWGDPRNPAPSKNKVLFVFLPSHKDDLSRCMQQYPGGELLEEHDLRHSLYYGYRVNISD